VLTTNLDDFQGNILTEEERQYRLIKLTEAISQGEIDDEFITYIQLINNYSFIVTTQCCTGHGDSIGAHFDFRSKLPEAEVINRLLRPMHDKFYEISFTLMLEGGRCRYCVWLNNEKWQEQVAYFLTLLESIK
jgi:hypothetical protein